MKTITHNDNRYTLDDWSFGDSQEDIEMLQLAQKMYKRLNEDPRCEYLGQGRHRYAFRCRNVVYKIAWNWDGIIANNEEIYIFSKYKLNANNNDILYARCRRLNDICIIMEYLKDFKTHTTIKLLPKWVTYIDGYQVGYSRNGKLKAYDYSFI